MWWFKRAVLLKTFADSQAMHPWFMDYERLEPGIRELVWTLNQTDLVETLSSCEGHPELPDWVGDHWWNGLRSCAIVNSAQPVDWVMHRLRKLAQDWKDVQLIVRDDMERWEQWLGISSQPCPTGNCPQQPGPSH